MIVQFNALKFNIANTPAAGAIPTPHWETAGVRPINSLLSAPGHATLLEEMTRSTADSTRKHDPHGPQRPSVSKIWMTTGTNLALGAAVLFLVFTRMKANCNEPPLPTEKPGLESPKIPPSSSAAPAEVGVASRVEALIRMLQDDNHQAQLGVMDQLVVIGEAAVEPLINALKHENWRVRRGAAAALGGIGDPRAITPLIDVLGDKESAVWGSAAGALIQFHEFGELGESDLLRLIEALESTNADLRHHVAYCLGKMKEKRAITRLERMAAHDDHPPAQIAAREALRQIRGSMSL